MDKNLLDQWRKQCEIEDQIFAEEMAAVSTAVGQQPPSSTRVLKHPMVQELIQIFEEDQFMIQPVLYRARDLRARIAEAKLRAAYTAEEYEAIRQRALELEKAGK